VRDGTFDVIFSDVVMPGMSGLDMAKELRTTHPELPVLLATGYSGRLKGDDAAGFRILPKPYGAQSLSEGLADLLGIEVRLSA
jgi:CheY-like chemotaxis protein